MEKISVKEDLEKNLNYTARGEIIDAVIINTPVVDVMKKFSIFWPFAHKEYKNMAELAMATNEADGFNVVNVPFDMAVESEALGCEVIWTDQITSTPQVKGEAFKDIDDIHISENLLELGRFTTVLNAIDYIKNNYDTDIPIIPFVDGPFTIAGHAIGINRLFKICLKDLETARDILIRFNNLVCIKYARAQIESGADFIMVLDPIASGLSGILFDNLLVPLYKNFNSAIKKKAILHICGNVNRIIKEIPKTGFAGFSFDHPAMEFKEVKKAIGDSMRIIGAIPTIDTLLEGSMEDVYNKTVECIDKGVDIVSPSCCIPPEVSLSNLRSVKSAIISYREKRNQVT